MGKKKSKRSVKKKSKSKHVKRKSKSRSVVKKKSKSKSVKKKKKNSKKKNSKKKRVRAKDFDDNPKIRRRFGEAKSFNKDEPWEVQYRKRKEELIKSLIGREKR